jgi:hypothetical protein
MYNKKALQKTPTLPFLWAFLLYIFSKLVCTTQPSIDRPPDLEPFYILIVLSFYNVLVSDSRVEMYSIELLIYKCKETA